MLFQRFFSRARAVSFSDSTTSWAGDKTFVPNDSPSNVSYWKLHQENIILGIVDGVLGLIVILGLLLFICLRIRRKKQQQNRAKDLEIEKLNIQIQILRDKIEEDSLFTVESTRLPPPAKIVEHSVFESDNEDESGPTILKRTKTFLKGLKGREKKARGERFDRRDGGSINSRAGSDRFENAAWGHGHGHTAREWYNRT